MHVYVHAYYTLHASSPMYCLCLCRPVCRAATVRCLVTFQMRFHSTFEADQRSEIESIKKVERLGSRASLGFRHLVESFLVFCRCACELWPLPLYRCILHSLKRDHIYLYAEKMQSSFDDCCVLPCVYVCVCSRVAGCGEQWTGATYGRYAAACCTLHVQNEFKILVFILLLSF